MEKGSDLVKGTGSVITDLLSLGLNESVWEEGTEISHIRFVRICLQNICWTKI